MNYIEEYNRIDFAEYSKQLKIEFNLLDVQKATWIKTKNPKSTSLLISLKGKEPLRYLELIGEQTKSYVYEYNEKPIT